MTKTVCPVCGSLSVVRQGEDDSYRCLSCDACFSVQAQTQAAMSASDIFHANIGAVMEITASFDDEDSVGTGFYVSSDGLMVTNAHVLISHDENGKPILCQSVYACPSRSTEYEEMQIVHIDHRADLALLRHNNGKTIKPLCLADRDVAVGDTVYCIGNGEGEGLALTCGTVGDVERNFKHIPAFLFSAPVTHGCSGGPVFNATGHVCGVTVGGHDSAPGMNYAVPVSTLRRFLDDAE